MPSPPVLRLPLPWPDDTDLPRGGGLRHASGSGSDAGALRAFLLHDLKNLVELLALTRSNAARHREDPAFVDDLLASLDGAVEKLGRLVVELRGDADDDLRRVDLAERLRQQARVRAAAGRPIALQIRTPRGVEALVDPNRLDAALNHLIDNALDAAGADGRVELRLAVAGTMAIIEVRDDGPGMTSRFVTDRLFTPFASTKPGGLGIGAYQARTLAEAIGGRLEVDTRPGDGTTMRLLLPGMIQAVTRLAR